MDQDERSALTFADEVARLRAANVVGESGRLRELFDFLAARGPSAPPASQAEIADLVFGQPDVAGDDATVRVYIHRLRKRLDEHYAGLGIVEGRLTVPAGAYALRFAGVEEAATEVAPVRRLRWNDWRVLVPVTAALLAVAFFAGHWFTVAAPTPNALWKPFVDSQRPLTIVLGDYYIFGDIDGLRPEEGRLIRDFRINSATDLARAQETEPQRYGGTTDMGLNYLPFSAAYALRELVPVLAESSRPVQVIAASQFHADELRDSDIIYIGLISGMGMLEDTVFDRSNFLIGETYDQLIDAKAGKTYTSQEAERLPLPVDYRDYGYFARFEAPGGALVAVIAGTRDTGLRGIAPLLSGELDPQIARLARAGDFEGIYQIVGQQGADLSKSLVAARARR